MRTLEFVTTLSTGLDAFDLALADLEVVSGGDWPVLAAIARAGGGVVTYSVGPATTTLSGTTTVTATVQAGQQPTLIDLGDTSFLIAGASSDTVTQVSLTSNGTVAQQDTQSGITGAGFATGGAVIDNGTLVLTGPQHSGLFSYDLDTGGTLAGGTLLPDDTNIHARDISAVASGTAGGSDVLIVGSQSEFGVTAFMQQDGLLTPTASVGPQDGLGIMIPTDIAMVTVGGQSYAIVASSAGSNGTAGALSVLALDENGGLTPTDHILDTRASRFGTVQTVEAIEIDGHSFVVAGGGDLGLSLFALTQSGQLIHLQSIADSHAWGLGGAIDIALVRSGDRLEVFVITEEDAGIAQFRVNLSDLGHPVYATQTGSTIVGTANDDLLVGGAGRDNLSGGDGDDVLFDGDDDDRLTGGAGADLFVFRQDGTRDSITDFNPSQDRIDLSAWAFLYDTTQLVIEDKGGHTRITYRDERLDVVSNTGGLVDTEALRAAVTLDVNRSFLPPSIDETGTVGNDDLRGSWGVDRLSGGAGDDTLRGFAGDDLIDGGDGTDTLVLNFQSNAFELFETGDGAFEMHSTEGVDTITGVEAFEFRNETLSLDEMRDRVQQDPALIGVVLMGTDADDRLRGEDLNDTLDGGSGGDRLHGRDGDDLLSGGEGNDSLSGGNGDDHLQGGLGNDTLKGASGSDSVYAGNGRDHLYGQSGADRLDGGDSRDYLDGGGSDDVLLGGKGDDRLLGQSGDDHLIGGNGADKISGNRNEDTLEGGTGDDFLNGGGQADTLIGGSGNDTLRGGSGHDTFHFRRHSDTDRITDFDPVKETLVLDARFQNGHTTSEAFVTAYAIASAQEITFDFGNGDRLILEGLTDLSLLADALLFD